MTTAALSTEDTLTIKLSAQARQMLAAHAAEQGRPVDAYAAALIERVVAIQKADDLLAAYRKQVAESGMSDEELDDFFRGIVEEVRAERASERAAK